MAAAAEDGAEGPLRGRRLLIVGVCGNGRPFDRLLAWLRGYAQAFPRHRVWVQHGGARLEPPLRGEPFVPHRALLERFHEADCVVTHAGCGSIRDALSAGHVPVVVPRRRHLGEHIDDHQLDLWRALAADEAIVPVSRVEDLVGAIERAVGLRGQGRLSRGAERLSRALQQDLVSLTAQRRAVPDFVDLVLRGCARLVPVRGGGPSIRGSRP